MTTTSGFVQVLRAEKIIRSYRKPAKKNYARAYLAWLVAGQPGQEPNWKAYGMASFMGAQAVMDDMHSAISQ